MNPEEGSSGILQSKFVLADASSGWFFAQESRAAFVRRAVQMESKRVAFDLNDVRSSAKSEYDACRINVGADVWPIGRGDDHPVRILHSHWSEVDHEDLLSACFENDDIRRCV